MHMRTMPLFSLFSQALFCDIIAIFYSAFPRIILHRAFAPFSVEDPRPSTGFLPPCT